MSDPQRPFQVIQGSAASNADPTPHLKRRLLAIMFTDIKGFSAMMGQNEERCVRLVEEHRDVIRHCIPQFEGTEHGTIGDAFVVLFESAVQAVQCAVEIQKRLADMNQDRPKEEQVWIRIGIHLGDVLSNATGDIYGDAVNIAARSEPLAPAGGLCITDSVYSQCRNKVHLPFLSAGTAPMKNIMDPPAIYTYHPNQTATPDGSAAKPAEGSRPAAKRLWLATAVVGLCSLAAVVAYLVLPPTQPYQTGVPAALPQLDLSTPHSPDISLRTEPDTTSSPSASPTLPSDQTLPVFSTLAAAEKRYQTGYEAFMAGHLSTAEHEFKAAVKLDPQSALGQLMMAYTYQATDRETLYYRTIENVYTLITEQTRGKDLKTLSVELQLVMTCAGGLYAASSNDINELFIGISQDYPKLTLARLLWGLAMLYGSRCDLAVRPFQEILSTDTSVAMAYAGKALCHTLMGQNAEAIKVLKESEAAHPDSALLDTQAGSALLADGQYEKGMAKLQKAIAEDPGLWEARFALLAAMVLTHQDNQAKRELSELRTEKVPIWTQISGLRRYGWSLVSVGRVKEAVETYRIGLDLASAEGDALKLWWMGLDLVYWGLTVGDLALAQESILQLKNAVSDPGFPTFSKNYRLLDIVAWDGAVKLEKGDRAAAENALKRLENLDKEEFPLANPATVTYPLKWRVLMAQGKADEALALVRVDDSKPALAALPLCPVRADYIRALRRTDRTEELAKALDGYLKHRSVCAVTTDGGLQFGEALVVRSSLALKKGDLKLATELLAEFHSRWPNADPTLPATRMAAEITSELASKGLR